MAGILGDALQTARQFQGLAMGANQLRQAEQQQEQQKLGFEALKRYQETAQAGNPDNNAMTTALIYNPDAAKSVLAHVGIQDQRQKQDAASFALRAATIADNPQQFMQAIDSRIAYLQQAGRDPKDTIALREQYAAGDVAGAKQALKSISAALVGDGSLDKSAYEMTFGKAPETMSEYQKETIALDKQRLALQQSQMANQQARDNSYYTFGQTAQGIVRQNARTGEIELVTDQAGKPIIGAAADPTLQGKITQAEKTGALNAESVSETKKAIKMNDQVLQYAKTAEELIPKATGSGVGAMVDAAGRVIGVSSESSKAAARLRTLSGWLTSNVPRMEGPQSNIDAENYKTMAAKVGDETAPREERIAALDTLKKLISDQKELNNQVLSGRIKSVYDPTYSPQSQPSAQQAPAAPATSRFKIEVVQ